MTKKKTKATTKQTQKENLAEKLVNLIKDSTTNLFCDEYGKPYAAFKNGKGLNEVWPLRSQTFKQWVAKKTFEQYGRVPYAEAMASAINTLEGLATFDGEKYPLSVRVARFDDAIFYDLGDWRAVRITPKDWAITGSPILFRRFLQQIPQTEPMQAGDIKKVLDFVPLKGKENEILFLTYLVTAFIPEIPQPPLVFYGAQGSAKSFTFRIIKDLIDPANPYCSSPPANLADLIQIAIKHYCVFLDNLSYLPDWLSDSLCRLCTGDGFSKRQLYTDDDSVVYALRRATGVNGRNLVITQADLLDRALLFRFNPIGKDDRKTERDILTNFAKVKGEVLGGIFTILSKAMAIERTLSIAQYPRMADYFRWALASALSLGYTKEDFERAFSRNVESQNSEAIEASLVARTVMRLIELEHSWQGSPSQLLEKLNSIVSEKEQRAKEWPKASNWLWKKIEIVSPNLLALGISVTDDRTSKEGRVIRIEPVSVKIDKMPSLLTCTENIVSEPDNDSIFKNAVITNKNAVMHDGKPENAVMSNEPPNQIQNVSNDGNDGIFPTSSKKGVAVQSVGMIDRPDPLPKTVSQVNTPEAVLGMPVEKAIELWRSQGAPVIHLGPGENCFDLGELLASPEKPAHLEAVKAWLEKVVKRGH